MLARHQPQEVGVVARRADRRVVAVRELDQLVVLHAVGLVDLAVRGVEALHAEALLRIEQEIVDLLGDALGGHVVRVVLVRREARPVARRDVRLADGQLLRVRRAVHDEARVALPGLDAQARHAHVGLTDRLRLGVHVDGRRADGDLAVVHAGDLHLRAAPGVEAFRLRAGKHVRAHAETAVVLAVRREARGAPEHDERRLAVLRVIGERLAGAQLDDAELEVLERALADFAQRRIAVGGGIRLFEVHTGFLLYAYSLSSEIMTSIVSSQSAATP